MSLSGPSLGVMYRDHNFPGHTEFQAKPQNSCFTAEFDFFIKTIFHTENYLKVAMLLRCQTNSLSYHYFYLFVTSNNFLNTYSLILVYVLIVSGMHFLLE